MAVLLCDLYGFWGGGGLWWVHDVWDLGFLI